VYHPQLDLNSRVPQKMSHLRVHKTLNNYRNYFQNIKSKIKSKKMKMI
jgi:hypothetical protein